MLEHAGDLAHQPLRVVDAPAVQHLGDAAPLPHVAGHHPVDDLLHAPLHLLGQVLQHVALEGLAQLVAADQVEHAAEAQRLVEEVHAPPLELQQHALHVGEAEAEVARQVLAVQLELAVDALHGLDVLAQEVEPRVHQRGLALGQAAGAHAQRVLELQAQALLLVQRGGAVALQRLEAGALQRRGVARLLGLRASRADTGKTSGPHAGRRCALSATKAITCSARPRSGRMSSLLTTNTIFLPHSRIDSRNARSLSVKGRSAEVTKSTRSERGTNSPRQLLVLAHHGVGAGRVHHVDLAQQLHRRVTTSRPSGPGARARARRRATSTSRARWWA